MTRLPHIVPVLALVLVGCAPQASTPARTSSTTTHASATRSASSARASGQPAATGTSPVATASGAGSSRTASAAQIATARAELASLPVKGRSAATGYSRDLFLPHDRWPSIGHGCTVHDQMVTRDLTAVRYSTKTPCHAVGGTLLDPYSGTTVSMAKSQLDHVVALKDAWQTGAQDSTATLTTAWPTAADLRHALARDPDNLFMTSAHLNEQKGESDVASWVPPLKSFRCTYAVHVVIVKARYHLWVTAAEKAALQRYVGGCPV